MMHRPRVVLADNAGPFALGGTYTFLLGHEEVVIVDPGPADRRHLDRLMEEVEGARRGTILLTHSHPDHAGGSRALARATGFSLLAHASFGAEPLSHGDEVTSDTGSLTVLATPGHSNDHLAFFHSPSGDLFVGDLLIGKGSTTWVGEYAGCVEDYLRSLDRIEALPLTRILPAHGPPIEDPIEAIGRFRDHRLRRIAEVRQAFEGLEAAAKEPVTLTTVEELVDRVYGSQLEPALRQGAVWSVWGILEYLELAPFPREGAPTGF